ncbi:MAG: hypothetical protein ACK2UK_07960 [Candidatus Promineifilaceae bacterium]
MDKSSSPPDQPGAIHEQSLDLQKLRLRRGAPRADGRDAYIQLRRHVYRRLSPELGANGSLDEYPDLRTWVIKRLNEMLHEDRIVLKQAERGRLIEDTLHDLLDAHSEEE